MVWGAVSLRLAQLLCQLFTLQTEIQREAGIPLRNISRFSVGESSSIFLKDGLALLVGKADGIWSTELRLCQLMGAEGCRGCQESKW